MMESHWLHPAIDLNCGPIGLIMQLPTIRRVYTIIKTNRAQGIDRGHRAMALRFRRQGSAIRTHLGLAEAVPLPGLVP